MACRQLGYVDFASKTFLAIETHNYYGYFFFCILYIVVSIFKDGRFDSDVKNTSLFMNFSCGVENAQLKLSECDIIDSCQLTCAYPIGISCSGIYDNDSSKVYN